MLRNRSLRLVGLLAVLAVSSGAADATMVYSDVAADAAVVYSDVFFAKGPYDARATELPLGERGVYRITVTDLRWRDVALTLLELRRFHRHGSDPDDGRSGHVRVLLHGSREGLPCALCNARTREARGAHRN